VTLLMVYFIHCGWGFAWFREVLSGLFCCLVLVWYSSLGRMPWVKLTDVLSWRVRGLPVFLWVSGVSFVLCWIFSFHVGFSL
jgi:hypothetical protein